MNVVRPYRMQARAAATEATRARILAAARDHFMRRWYDEVTLQDVARGAGVSVQTVLNHFGGKEQLLVALGDHVSEEIRGRRAVVPGDVRAAVEALVDDYELTGDPTIRMLALEERVEGLSRLLDVGRRSHRDWVASTLGGGDHLPELVVATDVYTWKLLRRDMRLSRDATAAAMRRLVDGVLTAPDTTTLERRG